MKDSSIKPCQDLYIPAETDKVLMGKGRDVSPLEVLLLEVKRGNDKELLAGASIKLIRAVHSVE